jgi:type IV pilus assembly protein PilE
VERRTDPDDTRAERAQPSRQAGVTFIELMAVVVIIAILGLIAIPSYRQYAIRAHRTEGKAALLRLATNQERFYIQNHRYSDAVDAGIGFVMAKSENGVYVNVQTFPSFGSITYTPPLDARRRRQRE